MSSTLLAKDLENHIGSIVMLYGYLVTLKNTRTHKGKRMVFGTFLDSEGPWIDTVHFPPTVQQYPFRAKGIYALHGRVIEEFGFISLEVYTMKKLDYRQDPRYSMPLA